MTFLAGTLAVVAVYSIVTDLLRDRSRIGRRVDDEFRKKQQDRVRKSGLFKDLGALAADSGADDDVRPSDLRRRFETLIEQSGLSITPRRLLFLSIASATAAAALALTFGMGLIATAFATLIGACLPTAYVQYKRKQRLAKLLAQLPDAFELMARVIRAGQTVSLALQGVALEFDAPIAGEFAYCYEQQNLGLPPEIALRDLAKRTGLLEFKIFVLALLIQQQTGGNLAELLEKLSHVVRERFKMWGKIKALTAEGRLQAIVLLSLPPALLVVVLLLNRSYADVLFEHPGILIGMFLSEALGAWWIRSIVNFDF
jgi:tight adherence protein B